MSSGDDANLALFELYLATAERVSDRRAGANAWMLSVNSALVGLYGYLGADKPVAAAGQRTIWLWAIPAAGMLVCLAWAALLTSYRQLNGAKFEVLQALEAGFRIQPFAREHALYARHKRVSLAKIERLVPFAFVGLYGLIGVAAVWRLHA